MFVQLELTGCRGRSRRGCTCKVGVVTVTMGSSMSARLHRKRDGLVLAWARVSTGKHHVLGAIGALDIAHGRVRIEPRRTQLALPGRFFLGHARPALARRTPENRVRVPWAQHGSDPTSPPYTPTCPPTTHTSRPHATKTTAVDMCPFRISPLKKKTCCTHSLGFPLQRKGGMGAEGAAAGVGVATQRAGPT